jgi:hypothetical protein
MTKVVTYRLRHDLAHTTDLCPAHASVPHRTPAIADVSHGLHDGSCNACAAREPVPVSDTSLCDHDPDDDECDCHIPDNFGARACGWPERACAKCATEETA